MADTTIYYRFLVRGGTAAALAALNEIPLARELVVETDTGKAKLGDGVTSYNGLDYFSGGSGIITVTAPPTSGIGRNGEYALFANSGNPILYGPKAGGAWPAGVNLRGPTGPTGSTGATGPAGAAGFDAIDQANAGGDGRPATGGGRSLSDRERGAALVGLRSAPNVPGDDLSAHPLGRFAEHAARELWA
jgi:hypothetical protein